MTLKGDFRTPTKISEFTLGVEAVKETLTIPNCTPNIIKACNVTSVESHRSYTLSRAELKTIPTGWTVALS